MCILLNRKKKKSIIYSYQIIDLVNLLTPKIATNEKQIRNFKIYHAYYSTAILVVHNGFLQEQKKLVTCSVTRTYSI